MDDQGFRVGDDVFDVGNGKTMLMALSIIAIIPVKAVCRRAHARI